MFGSAWGSCVANYPGFENTNTATLQCLFKVYHNVLDFAFAIAGTIAITFVLYAAFRFVTSRGSPEQVESSKKTLTYALIGFSLVLLTYAILRFVLRIFAPGLSLEQIFNTNVFPNPSP